MYKEEEEDEEYNEGEEEGSPALPVPLLVWGRSGDLGASSVQGGISCRGEVQEPSQSSYTSCHVVHIITITQSNAPAIIGCNVCACIYHDISIQDFV